MKKINMVDLNGQYRKIRWQVNREIKKVIKSSSFINGPSVKEFQDNLQNFLGISHVIPCANGTDALQVALMSLELNKGDEVITTNFSFASTIEVILLLGLKPVVVDIDPKTFNINPSLIKDKISDKTKAIIPVHLFGQTCNMEEILKIANKHNLFVIEDNAQALGSKYKFSSSEKQMAGTIGDISTTSFFPSKNLGCYGDGGAIMTNSDNLAYKIRGLVNHGMYERYYHDEIGVNSRLDSIQAAILNVKLKYLNKYNNSRQESAKLYNEKFEKVEEMPAWGYRYKVRIIGHHDQEESSVTAEQLPWAQVMYPVTAGTGHGGSYQSPAIRQGSFVFGFFLDGKDQQTPIIMGCLGNNAKTKLAI